MILNEHEILMLYGKKYGGSDPELFEGDNFRMIISVPEFGENPASVTQVRKKMGTGAESGGGVTPQVAPQVAPPVAGQVEAQVGTKY